jgi:broad specificity phosphatase PhoE
MIIYLARHGQTTGDIENRYGGDYDDHLTDIGKHQCEQLATGLSDKQVEMLFTSPKIRAQEAAIIVSKKLRLSAVTLENFKERNGYGVMTGMIKEEAAKLYPAYAIELQKNVHYNVEGTELYSDFQQRIITALADVSKRACNRIAIVTHGGPIRLIFRDILKLGEIDVDDCALAVIEADADNGQYKLLEMSRMRLA